MRKFISGEKASPLRANLICGREFDKEKEMKTTTAW